jgi:hypothetical protein
MNPLGHAVALRRLDINLGFDPILRKAILPWKWRLMYCDGHVATPGT